MSAKTRVCIIGAGPSGMSAAYQFAKMDSSPEFVLYEKQDTWGGLWNFSWRTGTDQYGELNHNGMYKYLWSNGPKECHEYPDYTFEHHFKKLIPSFPPRAVMKNYLEGRWNSASKDLKQYIKFNHVVRNVHYRRQSDDFLVTVEQLDGGKQRQEVYSHVMVGTGIFNVPDVPAFPGMEKFNGRIMHSHDFRDAREFKNQRILAVGGSYSAEDVALQCWKYGAKSVICSWRTKPMGFKWPKSVEERPLLQRLDGQTAYFKDGSSAEIDCIILCTGYKYHFPFMETDLRLFSPRRLYYPDNLYKGTLFLGGGNNKVFYLGVQDQWFSFTMFDAQALWACKYIMQDLAGEPKTHQEMRKDVEVWLKKFAASTGWKDDLKFQTEFVAEFCRATGYDERCLKTEQIFTRWMGHRIDDIVTYRDQSHTCSYTNKSSPKYDQPWATAYDDSLEGFVKKY